MATAKKLPSGKYRCRASYTDEFGNYKTKSFTAATKKEAENLASNFIMEREHKAKPENKTLGELADAFLESKSEILSPSTLRGYKSIRKNAFKSIIDVRLGILTKELYQKAVNEYAKGRSPKTVLSAHTFFNNLLKENDIFVGEKATLPRKVKKETEIPTTVEVQSFLKAIYGTEFYLYCLFSVCLGLRKSETIALQWKDIDWDKKSISINKARVRDTYGEYVIKQTKTFDGTRTLHLPPVLISALGEAGDPEEYIITDSPKALESRYQREKKRLGLPPFYLFFNGGGCPPLSSANHFHLIQESGLFLLGIVFRNNFREELICELRPEREETFLISLYVMDSLMRLIASLCLLLM